MSESVDRASASSSSRGSDSPSSMTSPAARSSPEIFRTTTAACSRGRRSGAAGTTVAATSATAPPITASIQRVNAWLGPAASPAMTIDCTAAWVTNSWPLPSSSAEDIASATIRPICHRPEPSHDHQQVGEEDADRDADGDLDDPAQPLAVGGAERDDGGDRGEERASGDRRRPPR